MDLNGGDADRRDGIPQRDTGVGVSGGVEDDGGEVTFRLLNPIHQFAFEIRLAEIDLHFERLGALADLRFDVSEGGAAINFRFPRAQKVQVWAIEEKNLHKNDSGGSTPRNQDWESFAVAAESNAK